MTACATEVGPKIVTKTEMGKSWQAFKVLVEILGAAGSPKPLYDWLPSEIQSVHA